MIVHGCLLEVLKDYGDNSFDSVVTDPPYGLAFMGKKWDYDVPSVEMWKEILRVLKPGGHALIACGTRTQHRMAVNIEDAGFEIRDVVTWLYGSGFPKSLNISKAIDKEAGAERELTREGASNPTPGFFDPRNSSARAKFDIPATEAAKQWDGFGTALKPACEFWTLARKPLSEKTVAKNVLKHGTGGLNIDACRVEGKPQPFGNATKRTAGIMGHSESRGPWESSQGRFPANLILDEEVSEALDAQSGILKSGTRKPTHNDTGNGWKNSCKTTLNEFSGNSGGGSRFFYVAKASKKERNAGLDSSLLVWETEAWQSPALSQLMADMLSLAKDTSEDILMENSSWSTVGFGCSTTDPSLTDLIFTISMVINLITVLKTSNVFQSSLIKENIQDAIRTIEASGLNLAASVDLTSRLKLNTTNEKTASLLGVAHAQLQTLLKIKGFAKSGNFHSTVKPTKLMEYLCTLVTPPGGTVLDPFCGSGSTGVAAVRLGFNFVGIEKEESYVAIAQARIGA